MYNYYCGFSGCSFLDSFSLMTYNMVRGRGHVSPLLRWLACNRPFCCVCVVIVLGLQVFTTAPVLFYGLDRDRDKDDILHMPELYAEVRCVCVCVCTLRITHHDTFRECEGNCLYLLRHGRFTLPLVA